MPDTSNNPPNTGRFTPAPPIRTDVATTRVGVLMMAVACIAVEHGYENPPIPSAWLQSITAMLVALYALDLWIGPRFGRVPPTMNNRRWLDGLLTTFATLAALSTWLEPKHDAADQGSALFTSLNAFKLAAFGMLTVELARLNVVLSQRFYRPGLLLPGSFLALILVGTLLLKLPAAVPPGQSITWVDSLFTMTSAVCVTGLVVRDTATQFTPVGQSIIALFIQLGGLGILVFGAMLTMLLGMRPTLRENMTLGQLLHEQPAQQTAPLIRFIVVTTLLFELIGALLMWSAWGEATTWQQRAGYGLFHAISAYCNAGFTLQSDSLVPYRYTTMAHTVILPLIVIGGLGYPVIHNFWTILKIRLNHWLHPSPPGQHLGNTINLSKSRLTLHTKLVLILTATLYIYGVAGIAIGQLKPYTNTLFNQGQTANQQPLDTLDPRTVAESLADASFMSVSARTAGFNSMPMDDLSPTGRFVLMTLMLIGASPGGTGGGMKTTTFALLALTVFATARQRDVTEAFGRTIADSLVRKAATVAVSFLLLVATATGLLTLTEPYPFGKLLFEAISAASTTGLSLGITGDLTVMGKLVIIATMFLGRIGPLALLAVLFFGTRQKRPYAYPHESVYMS